MSGLVLLSSIGSVSASVSLEEIEQVTIVALSQQFLVQKSNDNMTCYSSFSFKVITLYIRQLVSFLSLHRDKVA